MQYKIRLRRKIVAIGSKLEIHLLIIPLLKDLKLKSIKLQIIQTVKLKTKELNGLGERKFSKDSDVYFKSFPKINHENLPVDTWPLILTVPLPNYLSQCCQDVETFNDSIQVKHKMILYINFINNQGQISQIKSKLPIKFVISPEEYTVGKCVEYINDNKVKFTNKYQLVFDNGITEAPEQHTKLNEITIPSTFTNGDEFLFNDEHTHEPNMMVIPPPYTLSQFDLLFEPESNTFVPSPRATTPISRGNSGTNLVSMTPKYVEIYDGEVAADVPAPMYSPVASRRHNLIQSSLRNVQ